MTRINLTTKSQRSTAATLIVAARRSPLVRTNRSCMMAASTQAAFASMRASVSTERKALLFIAHAIRNAA